MSNLAQGELLGHPKCLFVLFFTELWERFSFYGMKALLILYMVNYLFWKQSDASLVMAWYAGLVYATPMLGGLIADKVLGARWSVVIGGVLMAIGHLLLAFEPMAFFYSGLAFLIVGCGFLKPNISTQVGALYRESDERRDSAFTIFYMGINLGAFLGPIICGWLRINFSYHHGFAAAGVGMVLGLIVYLLGMGSVERRTRQIAELEAEEKEVADNPPGDGLAQPADEVPAYVYRDRSIVLVVICVFAILFWVGFEQAANVMNLWAQKHTNLHVFQAQAPEVIVNAAAAGADATTGGNDGFALAAEQTQSINPLFIITLAPVFAFLWTWLEKRKRQPSTPMKMALGVFFATLAYGAMLASAAAENRPTQAPLAAMPDGLEVDAEGRVLSTEVDDTGAEQDTHYGATRLRWENGTLLMNGVLTDLDWTRALGESSTAEFHSAVERLIEQAEARAEEVRVAKKAGEMDRDATWEVEVVLPETVGDLTPIAGWPTKDVDGTDTVTVSWDAPTRTLKAFDVLSDRDRAQILANGAEPTFRDALTSLYRQSSVVKVSIGWLCLFYFLVTIGELCLSPVGLSLVTKAAPPKLVGLFMGFWFFTTGAVSNFMAHLVGGYWGTMTPTQYFMIFGVVAAAATIIMLLMLRVLKPLLHGVH